jgi:virginiamycin A acetyltransferase
MKALLKIMADGCAQLLVLPAVLLYGIGAALFGSARAFPGWSQAFSLPPGLTGNYLRRAFYRFVFPRCGANSCICFGVIFSHPTAEIGANVYLGPFCCLGDVTLEDDVLLGSHVAIMNGSGQHGISRLDIPVRDQPGRWPRITIGRDTWIGDRAVVMANVGKHCVVGAGAVVTRPIEDYAIAVGSPARVIGSRKPAAPNAAPDNQCQARSPQVAVAS